MTLLLILIAASPVVLGLLLPIAFFLMRAPWRSVKSQRTYGENAR